MQPDNQNSAASWPCEEDVTPELQEWFSVSGDMDDFIYFQDSAKPHSEK